MSHPAGWRLGRSLELRGAAVPRGICAANCAHHIARIQFSGTLVSALSPLTYRLVGAARHPPEARPRRVTRRPCVDRRSRTVADSPQSLLSSSQPQSAEMAARVCHGHFEKFAQARLEFVRNIAALAERPEYLEVSRERTNKAFFGRVDAPDERVLCDDSGIRRACCSIVINALARHRLRIRIPSCASSLRPR